ncbi:hypothetical protein NUSPORA_01137 [Nucleospora cyclopteri]
MKSEQITLKQCDPDVTSTKSPLELKLSEPCPEPADSINLSVQMKIKHENYEILQDVIRNNMFLEKETIVKVGQVIINEYSLIGNQVIMKDQFDKDSKPLPIHTTRSNKESDDGNIEFSENIYSSKEAIHKPTKKGFFQNIRRNSFKKIPTFSNYNKIKLESRKILDSVLERLKKSISAVNFTVTNAELKADSENKVYNLFLDLNMRNISEIQKILQEFDITVKFTLKIKTKFKPLKNNSETISD